VSVTGERERDLRPVARHMMRTSVLSTALGQLLTIDEVAVALGVSTRTVRRLMRRGLPSVRFGRLVRFEQRDLLRWVEARKEA
jgi:excisionase family DNA binding protein